MSEYTVVQVEYSDPICIKETLKELGYIFEEHKEAQSLMGYGGDERKEKANIIVRKQHVGPAANDVGFCKKANGKYELIISEYDRRAGSKSAMNFLEKMKPLYAKHKGLQQLRKMGKIITSVKTQPNGQIVIVAS
jgi:hypothetical protein